MFEQELDFGSVLEPEFGLGEGLQFMLRVEFNHGLREQLVLDTVGPTIWGENLFVSLCFHWLSRI